MSNQFVFQGTVSALEVKTTQKGKQFATFTLQSQEEGYQGAVKHIFVKMTGFGEAGSRVIQAGEGAELMVKGKIESREWQGKHYVDLKAMEVAEVGDELPF